MILETSMLNRIVKHTAGQSVIEIIIAVSIFIMLAGGAVSVVLGSLLSVQSADDSSRAFNLASGGLSAVRSIRNQSWNNLTSGDHGLSGNSGNWEFSGSSDIADKFERIITVNPVYRDTSYDIVSTGGTEDANTKEVISSVSWENSPGNTNHVDLVEYFTNWQTSGSVVTPPTPTPTPIPTPTPTPTPATSCSQICIGANFSGGTCRANNGACNQSGETQVTEGNQYCTGGANADTCCCFP
jgi:hypothetical protein